MKSPLERIVHFTPGFDRRDENYGISGGKFLFVVKGTRGAVHFVLGTKFYPLTAELHLVRCYTDGRMGRFGPDGVEGIAQSYRPLGFDVGYHAHEPQYEGQAHNKDSCEWLDGKPCYSDGSAVRADEWAKQFLEGGTEWLWPALEQEYAERFCAADADVAKEKE